MPFQTPGGENRSYRIDPGGIADSFGTTISASSAAGGNAQFCALTVVAGAVYSVRVVAILTGTAETGLANLTLRQNGATITQIPTITGVPIEVIAPRVTAAGTVLNVTSVAASTAGAFYTVHLLATRVE